MKNIQSPKRLIKINFCGMILLLMLLISCTKSGIRNPTLPAATQNGSNTMGAYINNVLWVPALSFEGTGIDADYFPADYFPAEFYIDGLVENRGDTSKTSVNIYVRNFNGVGTYILNANPYGIIGNAAQCQTSINDSYITDSLHQGSVNITHFDPNQHIVSGNFQIKLINEHNPSDSIYISSGRFDVKCPLTFIRE